MEPNVPQFNTLEACVKRTTKKQVAEQVAAGIDGLQQHASRAVAYNAKIGQKAVNAMICAVRPSCGSF